MKILYRKLGGDLCKLILNVCRHGVTSHTYGKAYQMYERGISSGKTAGFIDVCLVNIYYVHLIL